MVPWLAISLLLLPISAPQATKQTPAVPDTTVFLEEMVVGATRIQSARPQPYALYQQDRRDLDTSSRRTLTERLVSLPGVDIQKTAPNQASPFVRGLTGEQTLLLLNGVRFNHAMMRPGPNQYAALIPGASVSKVQAVLGGSSVVTGSDGLTGVLDFRLEAPGRGVEAPAAGSLGFRGSTAEGGELFASFDGSQGRWSYSVEGGGASFGDLRGGKAAGDRLFGSASGPDIPNTGYDQGWVASRIGLDLDSGGTLTLAAGRTDQLDTRRPDGFFENTGVASRIHRGFDPQRFAYVHLRHRIDGLQTTAWWHQHLERQRREDLTGGNYRQREFDDRIDIFGLDVQANKELDAHHLVYGATIAWEGTQNSYSEGRGADPATASDHEPDRWNSRTTVPDGARYTSVGAYLQNRWELSRRAQLLGGLRYSRASWSADVSGRGYTVDDIDGDAQQVTASLRGSWQPDRRWTAFAGASGGFRAPNLTNLSGRQDRGSSGVAFQGDPDLQPETSRTLEAGLRHSRRGGHVAATSFVTRIDQLIQRVFGDRDGDGETEAFQANAEDALLWGFELSTDVGKSFGRDRFAVESSTSWVRGEVDVPQADGTVARQNLSRANRMFGTARISWQRSRGWSTQALLRWSAPYDRPSPRDAGDVRMTVAGAADGSMPGFAVLDLSVHAQLGRQTLALALENVFDKTYRQVGSGVDGPGRNLVLWGRARF